MLKKFFKNIIWVFTVIFIFINIIAFFQVYNLTHFSEKPNEKLETNSKIINLKIALLGQQVPKIYNHNTPSLPYKTIVLNSNKKIECWHIENKNRTQRKRGTFIICHGYGFTKSRLLNKTQVLDSLGFDCLMLDFMGFGGSDGLATSVGYLEAQQVKSAYDYLIKNGEKNIYIIGSSMGAAATMKAIKDFNIKPKKIILEHPFANMYESVSRRLQSLNIPRFPFAGLVLFYGGLQQGYWAFGHNPVEYASKIECPTLLLYGEKDKTVFRDEIDQIFYAIKSEKLLKTYPNAGHENFLIQYKSKWTKDVSDFLKND